MRATVCLPTYNERENLEPMLARARRRAARRRPRARDRRQLARRHRRARRPARRRRCPSSTCCTARTKEGLGPAYLAGFRHVARRRRRAGPRDGLRLLARPARRAAPDRRRPRTAPTSCSARATCRVGASATGGSSAVRSRAARSLYTALFLRMGVKDPTGGFKCFRRRVLETIDLDAITARGYAFQIETTYRAKQAGFTVVEVPITFDDRTEGQLEDEPPDRARGDLARAAPPLRPLTSPRARRHRRELRARGAAGGGPRHRRLLGAVVRAVQGDRACARGARGRLGARRVREASTSTRTPARPTATACSRSRP